MFLEFYRLNEQPFGVTPDPRFLYMGPAHQEAFSSLVYGIETGRGFMALIAHPGMGKTTILLRLMESLRESARTAFLFQTHTNSVEFLKSLLTDLDVEPAGEDLGDLQRQLGDVLIQETPSGKRIVVAIDEAQNLDAGILEMVRMLSNFETIQAKLLQIVLVGQPQLADKLASPGLEQLRQRVSIIAHFPPLDADDVPKYIDYRLRVAGYEGDPLFTPKAMGLIVTHSRGIPRNINNLCFQSLSLGYAKNQKVIDDATLREVIADLSLESLGTSPPSIPEKIPATFRDKGDTGEKVPPRQSAKVDLTLPVSEGGIGSAPIAHHKDSSLDAIDLSHGLRDHASRTHVTAHGRDSAGHRRRHSARPLLLFGLAILLGYLWAGPGAKPSLDYLEKLAGIGGSSSKSAQVTPLTAQVTTPAAQVTTPSPAGTNAPSTQVAPPSSQPAQDKEATQPPSTQEALTAVANEATTTTEGGENSDVVAPKPNPSRTSRRTGAYEHKAATTSEEGYEPGGGRLVVESSVNGARITLNGESNPKWITPHLFSLAPGTYVVSVFRGGYSTVTRRVHVDDGQEQWVMAELENQEGGIFTVDTTPPGMQVFIDGKPFGPSRVDTVLSPGWHVCEVIPGQGFQALVSHFHLNPGQALTRRIRIGPPAGSSENYLQRQGTRPVSNSTDDPQRGTTP